MTIRVAIVAPALAMRAGLTALLREDGDAVTVVADAATVADLEAPLTDIDVLVLTPETTSRAELADELADAAGDCALLLLTDDPDSGRVLAGVPALAWGLLPVDTSPEELNAAIRALDDGLVAGAPALMQALVSPLLTGTLDIEQNTLAEPLTDRELEVLQLVAQGLANKQIAEELYISEHTVKFHVSSIYGKLGATNRAEAVTLGIRQGLITL